MSDVDCVDACFGLDFHLAQSMANTVKIIDFSNVARQPFLNNIYHYITYQMSLSKGFSNEIVTWPLPVTVANKGLQTFPSKNVIILVVTGILGGGPHPACIDTVKRL